MTWAELSKRVATRSGESKAATQRVLDALMSEVSDALAEGGSVSLPKVGRISSAWRESRTLRSIGDGRKMMLDGRYVARFKAAQALRERLTERTPQSWRSPQAQQAWRLAETLIGDLALYHPESVPADVKADDSAEQVEARCASSFGAHWERVVGTFRARTEGASLDEPYLALAARRRWAR
ncbi:MAG: HU family DNA-binding protein [Alphaproteobacteria bacterium]|nr:HU family DNA-binding protein [Alphaproteobacteria bacterium]MCB9699878.1 HU family DNA-binding protein [Alphaproteobacteria bacterium]